MNISLEKPGQVDLKIIKAYDVWGEKQFMGRIFDGIIRTTFIIDEKGRIEEVIKKVDTKNHAEQILERASKN
jgi:peroxiredoxin Q/BCP